MVSGQGTPAVHLLCGRACGRANHQVYVPNEGEIPNE